MSAVHAGGDGERSTLDIQAKAYLVDILATVGNDIECLASHVESYVSVQAEAVDSLTSQVDLVKTRISLAKTNAGLDRFDELRCAASVPEVISGNIVASKATEDTVDEEQQLVNQTPSFTSSSARLSIEERMSKYDNVGLCLAKENVK